MRTADLRLCGSYNGLQCRCWCGQNPIALAGNDPDPNRNPIPNSYLVSSFVFLSVFLCSCLSAFFLFQWAVLPEIILTPSLTLFCPLYNPLVRKSAVRILPGPSCRHWLHFIRYPPRQLSSQNHVQEAMKPHHVSAFTSVETFHCSRSNRIANDRHFRVRANREGPAGNDRSPPHKADCRRRQAYDFVKSTYHGNQHSSSTARCNNRIRFTENFHLQMIVIPFLSALCEDK